MLSKLIHYGMIFLFVLVVVWSTERFVYTLAPPVFALTIIDTTFLLSPDITIANMSDRMKQAMFVLLLYMIVFILMRGLLTTIASMPQWAQNLTLLFPPRYFLEIMRSVYLRGTSFSELSQQFVTLAAFAMLLNMLAAASYKKNQNR